MLSMTLYGMEYPFGQLGTDVPAMSPPNFLFPPSLLPGGELWGAEEALTLCKHCSAVTKNICVWSTLLSAQIQYTAPS